MKEKRKPNFKKLYVYCTWSVAIQYSNSFLKKELSLISAALNRQKFQAVIISNGRLLHPPSPVLPICLRIARAGPTKNLKAISFPEKK